MPGFSLQVENHLSLMYSAIEFRFIFPKGFYAEQKQNKSPSNCRSDNFCLEKSFRFKVILHFE